jgi:hypothetical protein
MIFQELAQHISEANEKGALEKRTDVLTGYSGESLFGTLQRTSKYLIGQDECYLEIGVYQGLTLLSSAMVSPENQFYGIDNFAFFDKDKTNERLINERKEALEINNANLINSDYEDALKNLDKYIGKKKIKVYFIDGPHDYRSQLMCLLLATPYLAENAIILIDDSNYRHVRLANSDFLETNPEYKLFYESYTSSHPNNMTAEDQKKVRKGWWNGINIIVKDTNNELAPMYPETLRDRTLYENDHLLHASQYPENILLLWQITKKLGLFPLLNLFRKPQQHFRGKFVQANTYSDQLPKNRFNSSVGGNSK